MLPLIVTKDSRLRVKDSRLRVFQYKRFISNKKIISRFGKIDSPLCFFCKMVDKTPLHLFYNTIKVNLLLDQLKEFISNSTPSLMQHSAILGHIDLSDHYLLINHLTPETEA